MNIAMKSESDPWLALEILNHLNFGIAVCEENGALSFLNATARRFVEQGNGLSNHEGVIHTESAQETSLLHKIIQDNARKSFDNTGSLSNESKNSIHTTEIHEPIQQAFMQTGSVLYLQKDEISNEKDGKTIFLFIMPLQWSLAPETVRRPVAMILMIDPEESGCIRTDLLRKVYGLTPAEARLAQGILQGMSLQDFAKEAGVSINTVRTQLKQVFTKTGTKRQVDLMRILMSGLAKVA